MDKSNSTFTFRPKYFGYGKYLLIQSFLSIQLLKKLSFNIYFIIFSLYYFFSSNLWFVFCNSFSKNVPIISSPLKSLITYHHGTVFLTSLITNTSSDQFRTYPLAKMFLHYDILTWSPTLNLGSFLLFFVKVNICAWLYINRLHFALLYLFTISSNLSIYTFCDIEVIYLSISSCNHDLIDLM